MGENLGCIVDLDKVPLKYQGLSYTEIWISEAQERMVLSVPPRHKDKILKLFKQEDVEPTFIGKFTPLEVTRQRRGRPDLTSGPLLTG